MLCDVTRQLWVPAAGVAKERFCNEQASTGFQGERQFAKQIAEIMTEGSIAMSGHDAFERILASLYDAMLDDVHWPAKY